MEGIPHHLVDVLDPEEDFHVVRFQQMAKEAMKGIYKRGHIPVVVGGTGFYIQALLYDIAFTANEGDSSCREHLEQLAREKGAAYLHAMLREKDPKSAEDIHENNVKRVTAPWNFISRPGSVSRITIQKSAKKNLRIIMSILCFMMTGHAFMNGLTAGLTG